MLLVRGGQTVAVDLLADKRILDFTFRATAKGD